MNQATEINPNLSATSTTVVNPNMSQVTEVNTALTSTKTQIPIGSVLADTYRITGVLDASTGEADLFLCESQGAYYVAKIYRRQRAVKSEVLDVLTTLNCPYVAKLYATGTYQGMPFEILPYYKNGSLRGKQFSLKELKLNIIPCINEALRALHAKGMIHKDLKPSNIMILEDGTGVAIIDFGISSVAEDGNTVLVTKTGMTPEYSAPETFRNLFLEESDYYSFGITLFELFCGYTPYKNMTAEQIAQFTALQKIPYPHHMPEKLQDLISGMTYFDITNRNQKGNINRRWTYQEVASWCRGEALPIPGKNDGAVVQAIPTYTFLKKRYEDIPSLTRALAEHWNDGKKQLYRGLLSGFFKTTNPEIAGYCMDAEEEATQASDKEDFIFWKLLYQIYPELNAFYWKGQIYPSLPAFGEEMLEWLRADDKRMHQSWSEILTERLLSEYLEMTQTQNSDLKNAVKALEDAHRKSGKNERNAMIHYYSMAYFLSGKKVLFVDGQKIESIAELSSYMKELLTESYQAFEAFCHKMMDKDGNLDIQFETWLIALGKREQLTTWKNDLV